MFSDKSRDSMISSINFKRNDNVSLKIRTPIKTFMNKIANVSD